MRIIKFPDRNSAKQVKQAWHKMLKPKFKAIGRKFKKDGEIYNKHLGSDHPSSTIIEFRFNDDLNGHYLVHPEVWSTWPYAWVAEMIDMIPEGQEIVEKLLPPISEDEL